MILLTGCGGGAGVGPSSRSLVENELYAGLSHFCAASDALDKDELARVFSKRFLSEKKNLNYHMQSFMKEHSYGNILDYDGLMQYLDYEIERQRENQNVSQTTITDFRVVWVGQDSAITSYSLSITSTHSGGVLDSGNLRWVKENGIWRIESILGKSL